MKKYLLLLAALVVFNSTLPAMQAATQTRAVKSSMFATLKNWGERQTQKITASFKDYPLLYAAGALSGVALSAGIYFYNKHYSMAPAPQRHLPPFDVPSVPVVSFKDSFEVRKFLDDLNNVVRQDLESVIGTRTFKLWNSSMRLYGPEMIRSMQPLKELHNKFTDIEKSFIIGSNYMHPIRNEQDCKELELKLIAFEQAIGNARNYYK